MSAAHELAERGFEVHVYERKSVFGGKARSVAFSPSPGITLPAEHGFRFFPGFYKHVIDTMTRIPCEGGASDARVSDNLVNVSELVAMGNVDCNPVRGVLPLRPLTEAFGQWVEFLPSFLDVAPGPDGKRMTSADLAFFGRRIWAFWTACHARREAELEKMCWSDFIGSGRSFVYRKYLSVGLTRNLVACKAEKASALTVGTVGFQLIADAVSGLFQRSRLDRVLNGPTNEVWIDPWIRYLQRLGVTFHLDRELKSIDVGSVGEAGPHVSRIHFSRVTAPSTFGGRVSMAGKVDVEARRLASLRTDHAHEALALQTSDVETIEADHYVFAIPVEQMATFVTPAVREASPEWAGLTQLATSVQWMNGVLFYMTKKSDLPTAHTDYLDSDWALTSVDQCRTLWPDWARSCGGDPSILRILSVDVSDWTAPRTTGSCTGKAASELACKEVIEETWMQIKQAVCGRAGYEVDDAMRKYAFIDDDIRDRANLRKLVTYHRWHHAKKSVGGPLLTNAEPLLVNQIGTRELRPEAGGSLRNAFLASDYVRTATDLATMEGANEAARRAVNALLAREGRSDRCEIYPLTEPLGFLRTWDEKRFRQGLGPSAIVRSGGHCGFRRSLGPRSVRVFSRCKASSGAPGAPPSPTGRTRYAPIRQGPKPRTRAR